jgi:hypothetical protein
MKKIFFILPLMVFVVGCSGIAPEAVRDESNTLTRPSFMKAKVLDEGDHKENQSDAASEK